MRRSPSFWLSVALALGLASVALLTSFSMAQPAATRSLAATYVHGVFHVSIPYETPRLGEGTLVMEILNPEDGVSARFERHVSAAVGRAVWRQDLELPKFLALDDLVWHRLRYRFTYEGDARAAVEGLSSISRILRLPSVHVLSQQSYLSGAPAAVRLIATERDKSAPVTSGSVRIELDKSGEKPRLLYTGILNNRGTTQANFRFPAGLAGTYSLRYALDTNIGPAEYVQPIRLEDKAAILLTTEKPVYQPGQTIHARALALDRSNHQAVSARKLTFEVEDSRGNKVFRKITQTDAYGVASAEFALADEVNLGAYHLRAAMEGDRGGPSANADMALQVQRYVLPRFKVAVELAGNDAKAKRGYRPGDRVTGTVRANYFFGKPVDGGEVTVRASGADVERFEAGRAQGRTDGEGAFHFDIRLPDYFAGNNLSQGAAPVLVEATVKDAAGHTETHGESVMVSATPLLITAVPEGGAMAPGLDNQLFVLASYPDGTPAEADIRVEDQAAKTDKSGVAVVTLRGGNEKKVRINAADGEGNRASVEIPLQSRAGADQVLLRTERGVYKAGERIRLQALSTVQRGSVYIDAVRDGQTIGTYDVDLANGRAELDLAATPEMAGAVQFSAYLFDRGGRPTSDRRLIFVQPADELKIETQLDKAVYKPGGEARIGFRVTNSKGEGVEAALGLEIVDQAVFALAEKQPGFAKLFFYLEEEMMKPRYEIHSVSLPEVLTTGPAPRRDPDLAARALFAATQQLGAANNAAADFGGAAPQAKYADYAARYESRLSSQIDEIVDRRTQARNGIPQGCDQSVFAAILRDSKALDPWGNSLRVDPRAPWGRGFAVRSAGPDGEFNTADDLVAYRENRYCQQADPGVSGVIRVQVEHAAGANNGAAAIAGIVSDASGAAIPNANVRMVERVTGRAHEKIAGTNGQFGLAGLPPGDYEVRVSARGFGSAVRQLSVKEGDRAVLSVTLSVAAMMQFAEVMAAPVMARNAALAVAAPRAAMAVPMAMDAAMKKDMPPPKAQAPQAETHVRSWFPESLYVAPEIITDAHGRASITIPIADNITTWRMAMLASTRQGALGSGTSSLKVFQDFFAEVDLPVTLTQGDRVSLPVAVYNYSGSAGPARLRIAQEDWFSLDAGTGEKTVDTSANGVAGAQFTIEAKKIGKFKLTLTAELDGKAPRKDIVVRDIEVVPNGREQTVAFNGRLEKSVEQTVALPPNAIPDAGKIFVRLYPGPLSQVVEGMDAILRMPYGCFEQTSSATYPNVLALDYMKRTKKLTPEVHAKAEGFIAGGYQRLLTFEVPGGGFSWFGNPPANKILTSYGLMEFSDMSKVHEIDPRVIERTQQWLAGQQLADGSWKPDTSFINEGATNRYNNDVLRITAYIAWALESSGYNGPALERARQFISQNRNGRADAYTLAIVANFAVAPGNDRGFAHEAVQQLLDARKEEGDQAWWTTEETGVYGAGASAAVETTGLAAQALLKSGESSTTVRKALNYIAAKKDASGTWGSTQATVMALRALLLSTSEGVADARGTVKITLNGQPARTFTITPENSDLFQQVVLKPASGANQVAVHFEGQGGMAYQIAGSYFVPWTVTPSAEPLSIDLSYDRTRLAEGDIVSATAIVKNHLRGAANMVMVDLGIPPGFDLLSEDLDDYRAKSAGQKSGRLEKFNLTPTQAILYFDSITPGGTVTLRYRLRAKYPIRAKTFQSRVYEYYQPEVGAIARPIDMEVRKR